MHSFYCSYDFHDNENYMVDYWLALIEYIFSINYFAFIKVEDLIKIFTNNGIKPIGLKNIVKQLLYKENMISSCLITSEDYFNVKNKETSNNSLLEKFYGLINVFKNKNLTVKDVVDSTYDYTNCLILNKDIFFKRSEEIYQYLLEITSKLDTKIILKLCLLNNLINDLNKEKSNNSYLLRYNNINNIYDLDYLLISLYYSKKVFIIKEEDIENKNYDNNLQLKHKNITKLDNVIIKVFKSNDKEECNINNIV